MLKFVREHIQRIYKKKMKTIISSLAIISLFLFGCNNETTEHSLKQTDHRSNDSHHHDEENQSIELNKGEKWNVDEHMLTHIRTMEKDVISFAKIEKKDYNVFAEKLQSSIDLLTSNCTMTGQAHDELHKWLLPYMDQVSALSEATNEKDAEKQFEIIQSSFITFNQYFQ